MDSKEEQVSIPVVAEEPYAGTRETVTGGVRVVKRTTSHPETIVQELRNQRADIRRVQVNREVEGPQPVRTSGNTVIVPVVEEVLEVRKTWVLKEEVHITRVESTERHEETVELGQEQALVEKVDAQGNVVEWVEEPAAPGAAAAAAGAPSTAALPTKTAAPPRRSILERPASDPPAGTLRRDSIVSRRKP